MEVVEMVWWWMIEVDMVVKAVTVTVVEMMVLIPARVALNIMLPRLVQSVWKISWTLRHHKMFALICFYLSNVQYSLKLYHALDLGIFYRLAIQFFHWPCYSLGRSFNICIFRGKYFQVLTHNIAPRTRCYIHLEMRKSNLNEGEHQCFASKDISKSPSRETRLKAIC